MLDPLDFGADDVEAAGAGAGVDVEEPDVEEPDDDDSPDGLAALTVLLDEERLSVR